MLVITYTSEHNHPWPTQRNALAGSTRSQPSKAGNSKSSPVTSSHHQKPSSPTKEEHKGLVADGMNDNATIGSSSSVKEEFEDIEKMQLEIDEPDQGFAYRPSMANDHSNNQGDDFFADLGEIGGADPLNLLFSQCFTEDEQQKGASKGATDPFSIFDWSENQNTTPNNDSSFGHEAKRPL